MKAVIFVVVLLVLVLGGGVWFFTSDKNEAVSTLGQGAVKTEEKQTGSSVVSSIKDAMGLGETMRCTYAGTDAATSAVLVSGKKFRATTTVSGMTSEVLFDGETQYMWSSQSPQGIKMSQACLESLKQSVPQGAAAQSQEYDYEKDFNTASGVKCEKASGVDFAAPTTVTFVDQCAMMEQLKNMMPAGTYPPQ